MTTTTVLLRSSSTPILNSSCIPYSNSKDSLHEPEILHRIPRARSLALSASSSSLSPIDASPDRITRALSETDLSARPKWKHLCVDEIGARSGTSSFGSALFSFSELDEAVGLRDNAPVRGLVEGGGGDGEGEGEGEGDGDGGWGNSDGGGSGFWDSNNGNDRMDMYYRSMIEANPSNPLFLSNYARYLKEVRGDYVKAEEYCERAILANPYDGNVLSMYAYIIWESHGDASRAETYFYQAVQAAPADCYVLASYAHFLWEAGEEDDVVQQDTSEESPSLLHGAAPPPPPPLDAAY